MAELAGQDPSLAERQPYRAAVRIWSRVGYRPLVTGGNSNGDIPMMRFAYTMGAEDALDRAKTHGWTVVSMKEDWSAVFASA